MHIRYNVENYFSSNCLFELINMYDCSMQYSSFWSHSHFVSNLGSYTLQSVFVDYLK